jgi:hypothetical protein
VLDVMGDILSQLQLRLKESTASSHTARPIKFEQPRVTCKLLIGSLACGRSQWPRGLRQVLSSAARTLGSQVRILLGAWMFVCVFLCYVVLCRYRPCAGLIRPAKESYQMSNGSKKLKQEPRMVRHRRSPMLRAERKRNK